MELVIVFEILVAGAALATILSFFVRGGRQMEGI